MSILAVVGTRPDTIKMAPVIAALRARGASVTVCASGQHRDLVAPILEHFGLRADIALGVAATEAGAGDLTGRLIQAMTPVMHAQRFDLALVHGDTATALAAAQAAFFAQIPVAHVEAGLRTGDLTSPWPEEMNRQLIARLAHLHFAPTKAARTALMAEGVVAENIYVTGNTAIDALDQTLTRLRNDPDLAVRTRAPFGALRDNAGLVLATLHRRESQGDTQAGICRALRDVAARGDADIVLPVHPNPQVAHVVRTALQDAENVHLVPPVDYPGFVWLMDKADVIVTDSGGIQEEAPWLGTPVLVARKTTERPEAIAAGSAELVGTDPARLASALTRTLSLPPPTTPRRTIYGDGRAADRIADVVLAA